VLFSAKGPRHASLNHLTRQRTAIWTWNIVFFGVAGDDSEVRELCFVEDAKERNSVSMITTMV